MRSWDERGRKKPLQCSDMSVQICTGDCRQTLPLSPCPLPRRVYGRACGKVGFIYPRRSALFLPLRFPALKNNLASFSFQGVSSQEESVSVAVLYLVGSCSTKVKQLKVNKLHLYMYDNSSRVQTVKREKIHPTFRIAQKWMNLYSSWEQRVYKTNPIRLLYLVCVIILSSTVTVYSVQNLTTWNVHFEWHCTASVRPELIMKSHRYRYGSILWTLRRTKEGS